MKTESKKSVIRKAVEFSMHHRQIIILTVSILVVIGIFALIKMPKQEFPAFSIRQGLVIGVYPGATSAEVEEQLTSPLEEYLFSYKEVNKELTYSISKDGMVIVVVQLNPNVKSDDEFWSKFRHGIVDLKRKLPSGVAALVANNDFGQTSALLISIESKDKTYKELNSYIEDLENQLRRIPSVSKLRRYGIQNEQISVYLEKEKLIKYGINTSSLYSTLFSQNFTTASGTIENDNYMLPIHVSETYQNENDIAEQIVYVDPKGSIIRLKDVARIVREYPETESYIANGDKKCVLLSIEMQDGNNIVEYGKEVKKVLNKFESQLPQEVTVFRVADQSEVVRNSVNTFLREMLIAICTVILVIMLLQPLRVAGIAAMTIPITIFISIGILYGLGYEINTVTLAGLLVVLGIIVDDSIVVIDNYVEKLDHGIPRLEASISSSTELFKSVISATLAITITFYPFLFTCTGMFREFLLNFPGTITVTLFVSLLIAMLLIPFIQYSLIKTGTVQNKKKKFNISDKIQSIYDSVIHLAFRFPKITVLITVSVIAIGILIFLFLPQKMMPATERNQFVVEINLQKGCTLNETGIVADSIANILKKDKRVKNVTAFVGNSPPRFHMCYAPSMPSKQYALLIVTTTSEESTNEVLDDYQNAYANYIPNAYIRFKQLDYTFAPYPIEIRLSGTNYQDLKIAEEKVKKELEKEEDLMMLVSNYKDHQPGIYVNVDNVEANRLGITKSTIMTNLALHYSSGIPMTTLWEGNYPVQVVLKTDQTDCNNLTNISNEYISSLGGEAVPLRQIADITNDWSPGEIVRRNGVYCITVQADVKRNVNVVKCTKKVDQLLKNNLELPQSVKMTFGGGREQDDILMPQIFLGLVFSVVIIFMILVFHFRKINLALLIISATSLSIFGGAMGIWIMGMEYTLTSVLGLVALMGIIVRNGIIMYDYAEDQRINHHKTAHDAALDAGKRRMRPIFLTSSAASMGVIPMIISKSALWAPMGIVICFGTWISMVFVVTVLPVGYWLIFECTDKKRHCISLEKPCK